jgi:hypothetical protein
LHQARSSLSRDPRRLRRRTDATTTESNAADQEAESPSALVVLQPLSGESLGVTHLPLASQTVGATQSLTDVQVDLQAPLESHLNGAQSCVVPSAPRVVCPSTSQVALDMHLCVETSQRLPSAQSTFDVQLVLQAVGPHAYAPQGTVSGASQRPWPSHLPVSVAVPFSQRAPHVTSAPAKPAHDLRSVPSQRAAEQGLASLAGAHAGRAL